ncbi:TPA: hypothetical protein ACH3X3_014425 [Trebouxia sp. C0006]
MPALRSDAEPVVSDSTSNKLGYVVLPGNESILMAEAMARRSWWRTVEKGSPNNFWWGGNGQRFGWPDFQKRVKRQIVNQVEGHSEICTKTRLAENLRRYANDQKLDCCWVPETFVVSAGYNDGGKLNLLKKTYARLQELEGPVWIVKPASRNRGNGIQVFGSFQDIETHLRNAKTGSQWVVQKYIEQPLLIDGRKFDIRSYCLITPDHKIHMYKHSYIRTSSTAFDLSNLEDRSSHLTNDAVQEKFEHYGTFEDSNKLSMEAFQELFAGQFSVEDDLVPQMRACAIHAFSAVLNKLNPMRRQHCFELFGLDFMVDARHKVYLIEVNTSPALYRHGQVLTDLLPVLIEEVVQKAVDPCFPPPTAEAAATIEPLTSFDVLIDTPSGRNMRRTISGSGRGAYNSTIAAAARTVRKTNSNNGNPENVAATTAVARTNSNSSGSSSNAALATGSSSSDENVAVAAVDRSLQRTNRTNADDSKVVSSAAPVEAADLLKRDTSLSKQLLKTASTNAASVYQQNLVIRTMRKSNSGLGANRAAFKV